MRPKNTNIKQRVNYSNQHKEQNLNLRILNKPKVQTQMLGHRLRTMTHILNMFFVRYVEKPFIVSQSFKQCTVVSQR